MSSYLWTFNFFVILFYEKHNSNFSKAMIALLKCLLAYKHKVII